ncbi:hypothetical protein [Chishuiella sp.]|uniref:hypothetical protein n=1 Tax=Chishuiella sp. TaxID=1969467 RepID=UPI0028B1A733|nr:hypothetical protein [Chishuiella sp.]
MNKFTIYLILLLYGIFFIQCNNKESLNNKNMINNNLNDSLIIDILKLQLEYGTPLNDDFYVSYDYSEKDYNVLVPYMKQILMKNRYEKLSNEKFQNKIKDIFKRELNYRKSSEFIFINFLDKCNMKHLFYQNDLIDNFGILVNKQESFISDFYIIPEILDYKKFNGIIEYENNLLDFQKTKNGEKISLKLWRDVPDLQEQRQFNQQLLIHRNKYLFNDNKASFAWLKVNDEYFLESLVTTFGYTKDKDLLSWVMKKNENRAQDFINENLFVKNCKGELEIREGILKYIEETTNKDNYVYFNTLYSYYTDYDNEIWNQFSKKEQDKMLAYLANTFDYLVMKDRELSYKSNGGWSILGSVFYHYNREDDEKTWNKLVDKFKENKYYGLPHLKELIDFAYNYESGSY